MGISLAGKRVLVTMKHVGVNVASDTLMVLPYSGVIGGLVLVTADDPGMHSSQNEQDNRYLAKFAKGAVAGADRPAGGEGFRGDRFRAFRALRGAGALSNHDENFARQGGCGTR